jgi:hypothetical protein
MVRVVVRSMVGIQFFGSVPEANLLLGNCYQNGCFGEQGQGGVTCSRVSRPSIICSVIQCLHTLRDNGQDADVVINAAQPTDPAMGTDVMVFTADVRTSIEGKKSFVMIQA